MASRGGWRNLRHHQLISNVSSGTVRAVKNTGEIILAAGKREVPLDEGTLKDSGVVIMAGGNMPQGVVCFGGGPGTGFPRIPYAVRWHETQANFQHGRKWHYLRDPVNRLAEKTIKEQLRRELSRFL